MPLKSFFRKTKMSSASSKSGGDEETTMSIGQPFNVKQNYHVGFNAVKGEFEGLPTKWAEMLKTSNIS